MCFEFHDHRHYQECWAADGRVLHRVVSNRAHRNEGVPIEILENMIARARAGLTSPTPVGPEGKKVQQTYVLAPSSAAAPSALWSLNRLESRLAVGEEPEPAVRLQEIFREANFRDDSEAIARGVELALSFGFLEQVPTILGTHRLPGPYRAALAGLAMDQEEASLAKTLLGPIEDPDPEWVATMAELSLDIAFALQDREQLLVLVAHPALSPSGRSAAVRQLIKWKEGKRLRVVLEATCPTLPDTIAAECTRDLALLKT